MILPEFILPSRANQRREYSGIDSPNECLDPDHFRSYPHNISYSYNSRGFRDTEWPSSKSELADAIWCVGDSFTVGVGAPIDHTWPNRLAAVTGRRVINVSMDGASNEWIARTTKKIVSNITPVNIVIMWSYTHRREDPDAALSDEQRAQHYIKSTVEEDWDNFLHCNREIKQINSDIIQFAIPMFHSDEFVLKTWNSIRDQSWPVDPPYSLNELYKLPHDIQTELKNLHRCFDNLQDIFKFQQQLLLDHNVVSVTLRDYARDGHHFDLITADWVANRAACDLRK